MFKSKIIEDIRYEVACESLYQECLEGYQEPVHRASNESVAVVAVVFTAFFLFFRWLFTKIFDMLGIGTKTSSKITLAIDKAEKIAEEAKGYQFLYFKHTTERQLIKMVGLDVCLRHSWDIASILNEFHDVQLKSYKQLDKTYDLILDVMDVILGDIEYISGFEDAMNKIEEDVENKVFPGGYIFNTNKEDLTLVVESPSNDREYSGKISDGARMIKVNSIMLDHKSIIGINEKIKDKGEKIKKKAEKTEKRIEEMLQELKIIEEHAKAKPNQLPEKIEDHSELLNKYERLLNHAQAFGVQRGEKGIEVLFEIYRKIFTALKKHFGELSTKFIVTIEMKCKPSVLEYFEIHGKAEPANAKDE